MTHVDPEAHYEHRPAQEEVVPQPDLSCAALHRRRDVAGGRGDEDWGEDERGEGEKEEGEKVDEPADLSGLFYP